MKFVVTDRFGNTVIASYAAWDHVTQGHPEMMGKEALVQQAVENPDQVHDGRTSTHKLFTARVNSGFYAGSLVVAVVRYQRGVGYLNTAYLSGLAPKGAMIWKRS